MREDLLKHLDENVAIFERLAGRPATREDVMRLGGTIVFCFEHEPKFEHLEDLIDAWDVMRS